MPFVLHVYLKLKIYPISKILHLHYVFPNTYDIHELKLSIICIDFQLLSDPGRGSDLETAFWVLFLAYNLRRTT